MGFSEWKVMYHIPYTPGLYHEEAGTTIISVSDDSERPLDIFLLEQLHGSIGGHAEMTGFETLD